MDMHYPLSHWKNEKRVDISISLGRLLVQEVLLIQQVGLAGFPILCVCAHDYGSLYFIIVAPPPQLHHDNGNVQSTVWGSFVYCSSARPFGFLSGRRRPPATFQGKPILFSMSIFRLIMGTCTAVVISLPSSFMSTMYCLRFWR